MPITGGAPDTDWRRVVTTEVQITYTRPHMQHLRKVMMLLTAGAGMSRKECEDLERALHQTCSVLAAGESDPTISVAMSTNDGTASLRIKGGISPSDGLASVCRLVDSVEVGEEAGQTTVALTKVSRRVDSAKVRLAHHLSA